MGRAAKAKLQIGEVEDYCFFFHMCLILLFLKIYLFIDPKLIYYIDIFVKDYYYLQKNKIKSQILY